MISLPKVYYRRFYQEQSDQFGDLASAVKFILSGLEEGQLYPDRIEVDGKIIWKQSGPFGLTKELLELVKK